jgi:hypothetical protein
VTQFNEVRQANGQCTQGHLLLHFTDMYALLNEVKKRRVTSLRFMIESLLPMTGHINSLDEWILITPLLALSEPRTSEAKDCSQNANLHRPLMDMGMLEKS